MVGSSHERKGEKEREKEKVQTTRERVVGADGVRDNTHGTDERVCF